MPSLDFPNFSLTQLQTVLGNSRQPKLQDDRYDKAHEEFERSSDQQNLILEWLKAFCTEFACDDSLKMLSVGCGSGILDNPLLKALSTQDRSVDYTAIDPNAVACSRFREDFDRQQLDDVSLEVKCETVESLSGDECFNIIHAVHSLYYFEDPADAIQRLLARLETGGKLVIFQAPKAELNLLADCFWFHDGDVDIWFSEKLENHLREVGCVFEQSRIDGHVDVANCFDESSESGALILDFVTQVHCKGLTDAAREQLLDSLNSIAVTNGDQVLVPHPVDVFEISAAS